MIYVKLQTIFNYITLILTNNLELCLCEIYIYDATLVGKYDLS